MIRNRIFKICALLLMILMLFMASCHNADKVDGAQSESVTEKATDTVTETVEETAKETSKETSKETATERQTETDVSVAVTEESLTESEEICSESETPPKEDEMGLDITNRQDLVSICYSVWFDGILGSGNEPVTDFYNIAEVLEGKKEWGSVGQFHYWGKPAQGYYRSTDKQAIRNNMTLLAAASIDFIILDMATLEPLFKVPYTIEKN